MQINLFCCPSQYGCLAVIKYFHLENSKINVSTLDFPNPELKIWRNFQFSVRNYDSVVFKLSNGCMVGTIKSV